MDLSKGWNSLINSAPVDISDIIYDAKLTGSSGGIQGKLKLGTEFNTPTGPWTPSLLAVTGEPVINSLTPMLPQLAQKLNLDIQMSNLTAPHPLNNIIFLVGNPAGTNNFVNQIPISLGGGNYNLFQISAIQNMVKPGTIYGQIPTIEMDTTMAPYTGSYNLVISFIDYFGPINLGIRLESSTSQSSMYEMRAIILPPVVGGNLIDFFSSDINKIENNSNSELPLQLPYIIRDKDNYGGGNGSEVGGGGWIRPVQGAGTRAAVGAASGVLGAAFKKVIYP